MWHTKLRPKRQIIDRCHIHHVFILQSPRSILCDPIWWIRHIYNCLEHGNIDVTGHCKRSVLGTAGARVTTHENSKMIWSFKGPNCFASCKTLCKWKKEWLASQFGVVYKLNLISNWNRISDCLVHFGSYLFQHWTTTEPCVGLTKHSPSANFQKPRVVKTLVNFSIPVPIWKVVSQLRMRSVK